MPSLRELQQGFAEAVFGRTETETGFGEYVLANGLTGARWLQVYRNNILRTVMR